MTGVKSAPARKRDLTSAERRLLGLLQRVNFGRVRNLVIRKGQPVFEPPPRTQRDHKLGGQNGARTESNFADFALKNEVVEMFRQFDALGNGTVINLEVRGGLPFLMTDEEVLA
jgi:hypothetical protein